MRWPGYVERVNNNRMPKMILNAKMEGEERIGRASKRWLDDVECDIKV
jgi:hypothetical protein